MYQLYSVNKIFLRKSTFLGFKTLDLQLSQPVKISTAKELEEISTIRITGGKKKVKKALFFLLALLDFGCSSSLSDSNQALFHHQLEDKGKSA